MSNRGNQATFIIPHTEPQGRMPLTTKMIRGGKKDRKERVSIFYHRNYNAFALNYMPSSQGLVFQVNEVKSVQELIQKLESMGFKILH